MRDPDPWWPTILAIIAASIIATIIIIGAAELGTHKPLIDMIAPSPAPKPAGGPIYW
jgi:hypothetical protein